MKEVDLARIAIKEKRLDLDWEQLSVERAKRRLHREEQASERKDDSDERAGENAKEREERRQEWEVSNKLELEQFKIMMNFAVWHE